LVDTATDLVRTHGPDGFSLRAAARAAGVDPAAVYRHFTDRSALLAAVAAVGFERLADDMVAGMAAAGDAPADRFEALGRAYVAFALTDPQHFRVMFGPYGSGPSRGADGAGGPSAYGLLVDALGDMGTAGVMSGPVEAAAMTAWAAIHGISTLLIDGAVTMTDTEADAAIDHVIGSVIRGLGA
jgi:AcrR family transcriptional regulator